MKPAMKSANDDQHDHPHDWRDVQPRRDLWQDIAPRIGAKTARPKFAIRHLRELLPLAAGVAFAAVFAWKAWDSRQVSIAPNPPTPEAALLRAHHQLILQAQAELDRAHAQDPNFEGLDDLRQATFNQRQHLEGLMLASCGDETC